MIPKLFVLRRHEDLSGLSGTGDVAWGVEFPDGTAVLRWNTEPHASTNIYQNVDELIYIHGHEGRTVIVWQ